MTLKVLLLVLIIVITNNGPLLLEVLGLLEASINMTSGFANLFSMFINY